jgi:hypothetical protein
MKTKNMTIDLINTYHKDFIVKQYEALIEDEIEKYESILNKPERLQTPLPIGTVINDGCLLIPKSYLGDYFLSFDPEDPPIIAKINNSQFK